jgi:hypothetical protein
VTDKSTAETVTIIGAGIGGLYLLAELGIAGFKLRLHDIDDSKLSEIRARGGVDVDGEKDGFGAVERARTITMKSSKNTFCESCTRHKSCCNFLPSKSRSSQPASLGAGRKS